MRKEDIGDYLFHLEVIERCSFFFWSKKGVSSPFFQTFITEEHLFMIANLYNILLKYKVIFILLYIF